MYVVYFCPYNDGFSQLIMIPGKIQVSWVSITRQKSCATLKS